jgi:crotonobetainyl-CoA:carnitine CoA-transferase CaiB-like acyl-CoA transferase
MSMLTGGNIMNMPLQGIRILDCTIWQQGPVATAMMGDLGAEVIKIEDRIGGDPARGVMKMWGVMARLPDGRNFYLENNNRNKKGITLDLKKEKGRQILYKLVEKSDVFVHNYRLDVPAKLGCDYETLSKYNPKLIYVQSSGYGPKGPEALAPAFDYIGQARSGLMTAVGEVGMPPLTVTGAPIDQMGATVTAYGILAALLARERLGVGQKVDVSMLGSAIWLQAENVASSLIFGYEYPRWTRSDTGNPLWNHYCCADGKWLVLAMPQSDRHWPALCRVLDIEDLRDDRRFDNMHNREQNAKELIAILDRVFATKTREDWLKLMKDERELIVTPVNSISDLKNDPQVIANEYIVDFDHPTLGAIKVVGVPIKLSKTPGSIRLPAPEFGQHTEEVLIDVLGYSWEEIAKLRDEEVM